MSFTENDDYIKFIDKIIKNNCDIDWYLDFRKK
jgi:hypothetical protein